MGNEGTWQRYIEELIEGPKKGIKAFCIRVLCRFVSVIFGIGVRIRNYAYNWHLLKQNKSLSPVLSIGNIVAGGTGKTPLTIMLARQLQSHAQVAVIFRGYKSKAEQQKKPVLLSVGQGPKLSAKDAGDEAFLLCKNIPKAIVISGKDRSKGALLAREKGAELILLEDGFQHRRLGRTLDVVMLDGADPFGKNAYLPKGYLRDDPKRLKKASYLVVNNIHQLLPAMRARIEMLSQGAPLIGVRPIVCGIYNIKGHAVVKDLKGVRVALFCGIAKPKRFYETLRQLGAEVVSSLYLSDHEVASFETLQKFASASAEKGATIMICTEKDWVKLIEETRSFTLPLFWVQMTFSFVEGERYWFELLDRAKKMSKV